MTSTPGIGSTEDPDDMQPLRDRDATAPADPIDDPAQAEWDRSAALDEGATEEDLAATTATGRDPDEIPAADDEIPAEDLHGSASQPESQGEDPVVADMGDEGEGDLAPEDA